MNIPNALTMSRFGMAGLLIIFLNAAFPGASVASLVVFVLAALTDALDGHLARNVYGCTDFGKLMDPLADKVLTAAAFIGFVELGVMPAWMVTLILAREFMVTGLRLLAADKGIVLAAGIWGKHKTIWQMIFIIAVLLLRCIPYTETVDLAGIELATTTSGTLVDKFPVPIWWIGLFVTVLSVFSGWHYFNDNKNLLTEKQKD